MYNHTLICSADTMHKKRRVVEMVNSSNRGEDSEVIENEGGESLHVEYRESVG